MTIRIVGLSGSLRRASSNTGLLRMAQRDLPADVELVIADIHDLPFLNVDVEAEGDPPQVGALKALVHDADALLLATPEYNYSLPPALKNAVDWLSRPARQRPLAGKPVGLMGAGGFSGSRRAQKHWHDVLGVLGMVLVDQPEVAVEKVWELVDENGNIADATVTANVAALVANLVKAARDARAAAEALAEAEVTGEPVA
ncbi:MAG TPA: NAD(P)H-dependent oxidoreductase [Acidimicrobiales bacterium]